MKEIQFLKEQIKDRKLYRSYYLKQLGTHKTLDDLKWFNERIASLNEDIILLENILDIVKNRYDI